MSKEDKEHPLPELTFQLNCAPRGARVRNNRFEEIPGRLDELEMLGRPAFLNMRGESYGNIAKRAKKLNDQQIRGSYLDYLWFPDVVTPEPLGSK